MPIPQSNALALEYQREYGTARRYVDITQVANYPLSGRIGRVFGPGFFEEISCLGTVQVRTIDQDAGDSPLVGKNAV